MTSSTSPFSATLVSRMKMLMIQSQFFSKGNKCELLSLQIGHYLVSQHRNLGYLITVPVCTGLLKNSMNVLKVGILLALPYIPVTVVRNPVSSFFLALQLKHCFCLLCLRCSVRITTTAVQLHILAFFFWKEVVESKIWKLYGPYFTYLILFTLFAIFQGRLYRNKREGKKLGTQGLAKSLMD